jgi:hypothetical protein
MIPVLYRWVLSIGIIITGLALMNDGDLITDIVDLGSTLIYNAKEQVINMKLEDAAKLF